MVTDINERIRIMEEIISKIRDTGYIYDLSKAFSNWEQIPPPTGTKMNCKAAAELAIKMAKAKEIEKGLVLVKTEPKNGFFVPAKPGVKAFGNNEPPLINTISNIRGWEFDNHYRVKDDLANQIYDPTFGTIGDANPFGYQGLPINFEKSTKVTTTRKWFFFNKKITTDITKMVTIYDRYKVTRAIGAESSVEYLPENEPVNTVIIDNSKYQRMKS